MVGHHGDPRRHAGAHVVQVGFAEVRDHIPAVVIQQGEDRLQRRGVLADGGFQRHHHAVERRAHFGKFQMQFSEGDLRQDPGALRHHGIHAGHGRRGLFGLQQRGLQLRPRRFLSGARLIEIFLGSEPLRHQRLKADTRGGGLLNQRSGALDGGRHRLGVILLRFDGALGQHDLRVEGCQPGFRVIEHCLIGAGVDAEQQIAFFHPLVIANGHLHDASADLGHYIDGISIDIGVIGLRRGLQLPDNEDQRQDGGKDQRQQRPLFA
ncbi:hypothetical protein UUU_35070 [Klebsiella pneumoniae subsp. pneumoniae DSM 30104 = JCM 1662 = NBRC 14940]|nr:hypothetical protein UUU_35070 [Klebsiella pneumoniae subsp. pneumoniae DSM 30104 = JCM 1662 = NBRC 14940]